MQKILTMTTTKPDMRQRVDSWDWEDGDEAAKALGKEVGLIGSGYIGYPPTPLHALGDGWRLMAPPVEIKDWFHKDNPHFGESVWMWWFDKQ